MRIKDRFETDPPKEFDDFLMKINKINMRPVILWNTVPNSNPYVVKT